MSTEIFKALKFCQGAVSKKDLVPGMTHFAIEGGTVRSYNGVLALCHPIPFDIDCKPKAAKIIPAIAHCEDEIALSMTPTGRLTIRSGTFRATVECIEEETPHVLPDGERMDFDGESVLKAFKTIERFIGTDASRRWQTGVLLRGQSAYATCNVILVEYWLGASVPAVINIPSIAIKEMIRINKVPEYAQIGTHSVTFHYGENCWLRTQLLETTWPDLDPLLNRPANVTPIDPALFDGLEKIKPFCDKGGRVYFNKGHICTSTEAEVEGAGFDLPDFHADGIYNIEMVNLLKDVATHIDFTGWPEPCTFYGERLRGVIIGMRQVV